MEFEAVDEGTVGRIVVPEGTEGVKVNDLIAVLLEEGEDAASDRGPAEAASPLPCRRRAPTLVAVPAERRPPSSSHGKRDLRLAAGASDRRAKRGLDLAAIEGSGPQRPHRQGRR